MAVIFMSSKFMNGIVDLCAYFVLIIISHFLTV